MNDCLSPLEILGLKKFLDVCEELGRLYASNPETADVTRVFFWQSGEIGYEHAGPEGFLNRYDGKPRYPLATFNRRYPQGLPFNSESLERAYWAALTLRIRSSYRRAS